jgi:hypothetical protein
MCGGLCPAETAKEILRLFLVLSFAPMGTQEKSYCLSLRIDQRNANHHLFRNGQNWWLHVTIHGADYTVERLRFSLATRSVKEARRRRDYFLGRHPHRPKGKPRWLS